MSYKRQTLWDILWDIFHKKRRGYICKTMGFFQKDYGKYWAKILGYIRLRLYVMLWAIFGKIIGYNWKNI